MAKYMVMVDTIGANPTHARGDTITDEGDDKTLYDIPWLLKSGAIEKMGADGQPEKAEKPAQTADAGHDMVTAPGEQMPKDDDKPSSRASHR